MISDFGFTEIQNIIVETEIYLCTINCGSFALNMMSWLEKYFFLDQELNHEISKQKSDCFIRNRKVMSILIPFLIVHVIWWTYMITYHKFNLFIGGI